MLLKWVNIKLTETWKQMIINEDLIINNPTFDDVFWKELKRILDWNKSKDIDSFDNYKIHILWWNFFLIESEKPENIENYRKYLDKSFKKTWELSSELIDEKRQNPENAWYFEYNWKYYIVIQAYNKLTDETDSDLWVYKWIIINSDIYYWINKKIEEEISDNSWKIDEIL